MKTFLSKVNTPPVLSDGRDRPVQHPAPAVLKNAVEQRLDRLSNGFEGNGGRAGGGLGFSPLGLRHFLWPRRYPKNAYARVGGLFLGSRGAHKRTWFCAFSRKKHAGLALG